MYAAQVDGSASWTDVANASIQEPYGHVWNLGRAQWWSNDATLLELIFGSQRDELSRVTDGIAVGSAP